MCVRINVQLLSSFLQGKCCDEGKSFLSEIPDSPAAKAYRDIIHSEPQISLISVHAMYTPSLSIFIVTFLSEIVEKCSQDCPQNTDREDS